MSLSYFACLLQRIKTFSSGTLINALASIVLSSSYIPFCYPILSSPPSLISHIHIYVFLLPSPLAPCSSKISSFCTYLSKLFFFLQDFSQLGVRSYVCMLFVCVLSHISSVQLFATLDCSPPGSSVQGILQAIILKWVTMLSSRGSS